MAKFRFRLASVLRLRESARDEKRAKLAEAYAALQKLEDRRRELLEESRQLAQWQIGASSGTSLNVDRILDAQRYQGVLQTELHVVGQQKSAVESEAEKRREALVAADQDVKVLEKLREHQFARFTQELAAQQMKQLDEVAARRHYPEEVR
jgi:flagellar FliJ protein